MIHMMKVIKQACDRGIRAVIMVPEASYEEALRALSCRFDQHAGRTARMPSGNLLTILIPQIPEGEISEEFDLYLSGWGKASPKDEREMMKWIPKARVVYNELS